MRDTAPVMLAGLIFVMLAPAAASYKRIAAAVPGTVVGGSDFAGGQIAAYSAVQQTSNPLFDELEMTVACCDESSSMADEIAHKINVNEITGETKDVEGKIMSMYKDKCSKVELMDSLQKGSPQCSYAFIFENSKFADLRYQATCVPSQICSENVAGMTDGRIALYGVVLRIMLKTYGELAYIGSGLQGFCTAGMNEVNSGNLDYFYKSKPIMWGGMQLGTTKQAIDVPGMEKVTVLGAFEPCPPDPMKGYLYIFDNRAWDKEASVTNVTKFINEVQKLQHEKDLKKEAEKIKEMQAKEELQGVTHRRLLI